MTAKNVQCIIWDWNGTLFDDAWLCVSVLNQLLSSRKMPMISEESYRRDFGFPVQDYYIKLGFNFAKESFEKISEEYITTYNRRRFTCSLKTGTQWILRQLQKRGIGQYVLSAYQKTFLEETLRHYAIRDFFSDVYGLDNNLASSKSKIARRMMEEVQFARSEMIWVGDTDHDVEVANQTGISPVLIHGGHQSRERLRAQGVPVFGSLQELAKYLGLWDSKPAAAPQKAPPSGRISIPPSAGIFAGVKQAARSGESKVLGLTDGIKSGR